MEIVYDEETLRGFIEKATAITPNHPVLIDKFLDDAIEIEIKKKFLKSIVSESERISRLINNILDLEKL